MNRAGSHRAVALVAERIGARHVQQPWILRTMRCVATHASLRLDRNMLVHKRSTHIGVALGADPILVSRRLQVAVLEGAVNVVTVAALDQALVNLMMEGHAEGWFHIAVALEAKRGLRSLEQCILLAAVNAMAAGAADVGLGVRRAIEIRMRARVAAQALGIDVFGGGLGGIEYLGDVAASGYVLAARAVAVLAGYAIRVSVH